MALQALNLARVFKVGSLKLEDPAPHASLDDVVRILSATYPQFRQSRLYEEDGVPNAQSGELVFTLLMPPPAKNG